MVNLQLVYKINGTNVNQCLMTTCSRDEYYQEIDIYFFNCHFAKVKPRH